MSNVMVNEVKNIMLTGATGFLGSHLLKGILNKTGCNIIILKRSFSNTDRIAELFEVPRIKSYDIDKVSLELVFEENKIDTIIHCATNYGRMENSCYGVLESNLMFPIKLLDLSVKYGVKIFINTDSYFNKENMSYSYLLNYALSKKSLLLWLKYFSKNIKVVNMVLEHIYGEDDREDKFVSQMLNKIAVKQVDSIDLTYGDQKRDFIYVDDVVDNYIKIFEFAGKHSFRYRTFDIGTGAAVSIKDFVKEIKEISNSTTVLNFGALPYREDEIMCSCADIVELQDIGGGAKYTFKQGLRKTIERLKQHV